MSNLLEGGGMRISAAAKIAPCREVGAVEADAMMDDVPLGAGGILWTESVELSSCKVKSRSSDADEIQCSTATVLEMTYYIQQYVLAHCLLAEVWNHGSSSVLVSRRSQVAIWYHHPTILKFKHGDEMFLYAKQLTRSGTKTSLLY